MPRPTPRPRHRECDSGDRSPRCYGFQRNCGGCRRTKCRPDSKGDVLPHLDFSEEDLERLHPRILAPPEEPLHDLLQDEHDAVYQHGLKVAKELQEQADESGRKRHPEALQAAAGRGSRRRPSGPTGRLRQAPGRLCGAGPTWSLTKAARRRSAKDILSQSLVAAMPVAPRASDR